MQHPMHDETPEPSVPGPARARSGEAHGAVELGELRLLAALDPAGLVDELGTAGAEAFLAEPQNEREIAALRGFLGEVRVGLARERDGAHARAAQRVTRRVLARTTREQQGWRGDLQLVGDFVADRLRASAWLRLAAATLFVQVTVVPILAWHMLREAREGAFQLRLEPGAPEPEFAAPGEVGALEVESPALDPALPVLPLSEIAPELAALGARVCAEYGRGLVPPQSAAEVLARDPHAVASGASALERALADRARALARGEVAPAAPVLGAGPPAGDEVEAVAARLVRLEQALDRRALVGHSAELSALLDELAATLETAPGGSLAAFVRHRAQALQVVAHTPSDPRSAAVLVPGPLYGAALAGALTGSGSAVDGPWARAWLAALDERR